MQLVQREEVKAYQVAMNILDIKAVVKAHANAFPKAWRKTWPDPIRDPRVALLQTCCQNGKHTASPLLSNTESVRPVVAVDAGP